MSDEQLNPPPFVVLEWLDTPSGPLVRVVAQPDDESEAHTVASALANAGLRVWLVNLWGDDSEPRIERYVGTAGAAKLYGRGVDPTGRDSGIELTELDASGATISEKKAALRRQERESGSS